MNKQHEALKLALEALNELIPDVHDWYGAKVHRANAAITAIREALAEQPAQQRPQNCGTGYCSCIECPYEQPAQQEPVLWQILNGVCHAGVRSTENLAKEAAAGMQKTHDLAGSLAAFHVRPLYGQLPASKPWVGLTDEQITAGARALCKQMAEACGVDVRDQWQLYSDTFKEDAKAVLEAAHGIKGDA